MCDKNFFGKMYESVELLYNSPRLNLAFGL